MGYYIEVPRATDKAAQMQEIHGARVVPRPEAFDDVPEGTTLLCVVCNGAFDAIGVIHDNRQLAAFTYSDDPRPRTWLVLDTAKVKELCPSVARHLADTASVR